MSQADPIDVGQVLGFTPGIHGAVELVFQSDVGKYYQIQISGDMATWDNEGYSVKGTGGQVSVLARTRNLPSAYYRLRDDGSPDNVAPVGPAGSDANVTAENIAAAGGALNDLSNVAPASFSDAVNEASIGNYGKPDCLWNTAVRMSNDRQSFKPPVLSILGIGDSWNLNPRFYFTQQLSELSTLMPASSVLASGGASLSTLNTAYDLTPNGSYLKLTASGHTGTFGYSDVGANGRFQPSRYAVVHYEAVNGGGSFKAQYEDSTGTWVDIATIDTNNSGASTYTIWESPAFASVQSPRIRVVWVSGSNKIYAAGATAVSGNAPTGGTNRQGVIYYNMAVGSSYASEWDQTPQTTWTTLLSSLKTDIVFIREARDDSMELYQTSIQSLVSKLRTARSTIDIVFIGSHPVQNTTVDARNIATDDWLRTYCAANGFLFVDLRKWFPPFAQAAAAGLLRGGTDVHMTSNGQAYGNGIIASHCRPVMDWTSMRSDSSTPNGPSFWKDGLVGSLKLLQNNLVEDLEFGTINANAGTTSGNNGYTFRFHKTDSTRQSDGMSLLHNTQPFVQINDQKRIFVAPPGPTWLNRQIGGTMEVHSGVTNRTPFVVSGVSGQTANLQEWRPVASATDGGSAAAAINAAGQLVIPSATPASASAPGTAGTISWDSSYIYVCTAPNSWKRVAISTW